MTSHQSVLRGDEPTARGRCGLAFFWLPFVWLVFFGLDGSAQERGGDDLAARQEEALQAAASRVAPSVVQIETSGGMEVVGSGPRGPQLRKGTGPTTGLIVGSDGYIVTSAYNFANRPTAILVAVPGRSQHVIAHQVATDHSRMLTLLKIEAAGLSVPEAAPKSELRVGQTVVALGRTWVGTDVPPSQSVGIISALDRIWGKAVQTDAKISPVNYGGPLVDLRGRVIGILVPASPQGQDETAGVEWYDSGIGFAIPLEDVNAVLPRLMAGHDLRRGLLGFSSKNPDIFSAAPVVARVVPGSPAGRAGIKPGDVLTEVAGVRVERQAQVMHALGPRYEGDTITVKVRRGKEELTFPGIVLTGALGSSGRAFLGILPMRDDPAPGVAIRYVFPHSAAASADLRPGDRIVSITVAEKTAALTGIDALAAVLDALAPGMEVKLGVQRKGAGEAQAVAVTLGPVSDEIPGTLPRPASLGKALAAPAAVPHGIPFLEDSAKAKPARDAAKKSPTGLLQRMNAAGDHAYWLYVPPNYDPNFSYGLVIWLHGSGRNTERDGRAVIEAWRRRCEEDRLILLGPRAQNESGWLAGEAQFIAEATRTAMEQYTIDPRRVVAHGIGAGGQMGLYLGLHLQELVRGVAAVGAVLPGTLPEEVAAPRLSVYLAASRGDPLMAMIKEFGGQLRSRGVPAFYREYDPGETAYLPALVVSEVARWIDCLDAL